MITTYFGDTAQTYWQRTMLMKSMVKSQLSFPRYWYEMLDSYYHNNGLYDELQGELYDNAIWTPGMKSLRNPVNRAVEFHVSTLWPGSLPKALPIITENDRLIAPIEQIWEWSNWATQKQVIARQLAGLGDSFIKVAQKSEFGIVTRVYLDPIKPVNVVEFELDERGFLTYIRIDIPAGEIVHTEVWSKTQGGYRIWRHDRGLDRELDELGPPTEALGFEDLGFDFIPIVHAKFRDIGNPRGVPCFIQALDKIDEANRQATRLHQILFRYNKPTIAVLANDVDPSGRPLPPPTLTGVTGSSSDSGEVELQDDEVWMMPGRSKVDQMVPNIAYAAALDILNAQMEEISKDLPEVLYYELKDRGDMSGVALKTLLGPAIDRVAEARGNAEPALVRAHQMALTIGALQNLFESPGTFENGDFTHTFGERDVIATSRAERASNVQAETQAGIPLPVSMKHNGFDEDEITDMLASQEYRLILAEKMMKIVKDATDAGVPLETILTYVGWSPEQLTNMGTQRLAQITLDQEDVIPETIQ